MEKIINQYETIFIINPSLEEEQRNELIEKFKSLIETSGEVENVDEWGKRRLAYEVNDLNEGYYVYVTFSAETSLPKELERVFKITEDIMRYIVIRREK